MAEDILVHLGEADRVAGRGEVEAVDVAGLVIGGDGAGGGAVVREGRERKEVLAGGEFANPAVHRHEVQLPVPVPVDVEVEAAAVLRPHQAARLAVVVARDDPRSRPVPVHQMDLLIPVGVAVRVDPGVGDQRAVGGRHGAGVGAAAVRQPADVAGGHRHRVDLRLLPVLGAVGVLVPEGGEVDLGSVGRPLDRGVVPVAVGQLARRAAARRDDEDVRPARVDVPLAVPLVGRPLDHLRLADPVRAVGPSGQRNPGEVRPVRHPAGERDPLAVGRPERVGGAALEPGDRGDRALRVHPANEDLGAAGLARRREEDAGAVRRPLRAAAVQKAPLPGAVRVHDPQRRLAPVLELVDPAQRVDDLRAVGRDLRVGHRLHVEVLLEGEGCWAKVGVEAAAKVAIASAPPIPNVNCTLPNVMFTLLPSCHWRLSWADVAAFRRMSNRRRFLRTRKSGSTTR